MGLVKAIVLAKWSPSGISLTCIMSIERWYQGKSSSSAQNLLPASVDARTVEGLLHTTHSALTRLKPHTSKKLHLFPGLNQERGSRFILRRRGQYFLEKGRSRLDVGRAAPIASPIRFESLRLLHDPYTLPAGNPIDP